MLDRRFLALPAAALLAGAVAVAGATGATTRRTRLHVSADASGQLRFTKKRLVARHPGRVTVVMANPSGSGLPHGIAIAGHGVHRTGRVVGPGGRSHVTARLRPGRYRFHCPVPGHRAAGMRGTLVVR